MEVNLGFIKISLETNQDKDWTQPVNHSIGKGFSKLRDFNKRIGQIRRGAVDAYDTHRDIQAFERLTRRQKRLNR